jgi:pimeloyl-ACP methyl ester carboxylesterase
MGQQGPVLAVLYGNATHLRLNHEEPLVRRFHERLTGFCQLVLYDERGRGMSDPIPSSQVPTLEQRMDDLGVVLDAIGSSDVSLFASGNAGPLALLFAVTHPDRVDHVVLFDTFAALTRTPDYPIGYPVKVLDVFATQTGETWGTKEQFDRWWSDGDQDFLRRRVTYHASAASPGQAEAIMRASYNTDIRHVLPTVTRPVLVLHREGDAVIPPRFGEYLASHIEGAQFVELEGSGPFPYVGDTDAVAAEIEEFITGVRSARDEERTLATVLFSDIVDSTRRAADLGDS